MRKRLNYELQTILVFSLICVFLFGIVGCNKLELIDGIIQVSNECGVAIDFWLDGVYRFSVEYKEMKSIEEISDGEHEVEARRTGSGEFVSGTTLNIIFNRIYTWSVFTSASIKIINNYGETLSIYADDLYAGDIADQASSQLDKAPYGDRKMEARTSDDTVVATTTLSVLADFVYEWTITK